MNSATSAIMLVLLAAVVGPPIGLVLGILFGLLSTAEKTRRPQSRRRQRAAACRDLERALAARCNTDAAPLCHR